MQDINKDTREIVAAKITAPVLVYAGPGSKKHEVIIQRIIRLIIEKPQEKFLVLTFNEENCRFIKDSVSSTLKSMNKLTDIDGSYIDGIKTFRLFTHYYAKPYREKTCGQDIRVSQTYKIKRKMKEYIDQQDWPINTSDPNFMDEFLSMLTMFQLESYKKNFKTKELEKNKKDWIQKKLQASSSLFGMTVAMVKNIYEWNQKYMLDNGIMDRPESLVCCRNLFLAKPNKSKKVGQKYQHIIIDDFQDINMVEFQIITTLVKSRSGSSAVFCVGDPNQLICGGNPNLFDLFLELFPKTITLSLTENCCSTKKIVDLSSKFIARQKQNKKYLTTCFTNNEAGEDIVFCEASSAHQESEFLTQHAVDLIKKNSKSQILILYRNQKALNLIKKTLQEKKVNFLDLNQTFFDSSPDFLGLIHMIKYFYEYKSKSSNYEKNINYFYAYPSCNIGSGAWEAIKIIMAREKKGVMSVLKKVEDYPEFKNKKTWVSGFKQMIKNLKTIKKWECSSLFDVIKKALELSGLSQKWQKSINRTWASSWNITNLNKYLKVVKELKSMYPEVSGEELLNKSLGFLKEKLFENKESTNIYLSTMHECRGLEYDVVFVAGLVEGILPHTSSLKDKDALLEEVNLTYVAITRAKKLLYLSTYKEDENKKTVKPSRYYLELQKLANN